jgi:hypothetical protein
MFSNVWRSLSSGFPNCPRPQLLQLSTDCLQTLSRLPAQTDCLSDTQAGAISHQPPTHLTVISGLFSNVRVKVMLWPMVSWPVCLSAKSRFLLPSDSSGFVDVGRPLRWEDRSVIYNICWLSPPQSSFGLSPAGLVTIFYHLRFDTPLTWRVRSTYLYPQGTLWPSYTPRHWAPFLSPPPCGDFSNGSWSSYI